MIVIVVASFGATRSPAQEKQFDYESWRTVRDTLASVTVGERVALQFAFLVPGSDTVFVNSVPLDRSDYTIDYHLGTVRVLGGLSAGATVVVIYQRQPFLLDPMYSLREAQVSAPGAPAIPPPRVSKAAPAAPAASGLHFGGTKSISFTVGSNQGTSLDQTLQASIQGQLTPTIKVKALLSDNNLPVQPEGNTEQLEYFDQVFVEIEGTNAKTVLGDFTFDNYISTFSPFIRQLKGMTASVWTNKGRITAAGATSKGVFHSVQFRGTTGLQGPYELLSAGRVTGDVIIAGTERVYMNGVVMQRGQNRDYVIDYDRGSITFTPKRLVTNDTEISVDFEVSQEKYDRTALLAAAEYIELGKGTQLSVLYAEETDDKDRPRNTILTDEDQQILRDAGDDPTMAVTNGVTLVDSGSGEYILLPADSIAGLPDRYVFDDTSGTYILSFVEAGLGKGDYELGGISRRGRRYFQYAGADSGSYLVGRLLPLPQSTRLVTARVVRGEAERITFDAEWNISSFDQNLFSSLDSDDDKGQAGRLEIGLGNVPMGLGVMSLKGRLNTLEADFKSFDRVRPQFYYRDWNLENVPLIGRENVGEFEVSGVRGDAGAVKYTLGRIDRDDFSGIKHEGNFTAGKMTNRGVAARGFDTRTNSDDEERSRTHLTAQATYGLWKLLPSVLYSTERYLEDNEADPDSGLAYDLVNVRLQNRNAGDFAVRVDIERRNTEEVSSRTTGWQDTRRDDTISASLVSRSFTTVQGEVQVTHRVETNLLLDAKTTTDLARAKGTIHHKRSGIRSDIDYEISQNAARIQERSVIFVGEGRGDYNASGELVGKGKGSYIVVFSPTEETVPTRRADFSFRLVWKPRTADVTRGPGVWGWILSNVSVDQTIAIKEETTYDPGWKVYLFFPSALQRNDATLFGVTSLRQDWSFLDGIRNTSLTLRYQREDTEDNRFEGIREDRFFGELRMRLSRSLSSRYTVTGEGSRVIRNRGGVGVPVSTGSSYEVTELAGLAGLGVRIGGGSTVDIDFKLTRQEDALSASRQTILSVQPRVVWRVSDTINVFALYTLDRVTDDNVVPVKPVLFPVEGSAHRWNLAPNIRLSRVISIVATYQGRRETTFTGARITDHELRFETRAFF